MWWEAVPQSTVRVVGRSSLKIVFAGSNYISLMILIDEGLFMFCSFLRLNFQDVQILPGVIMNVDGIALWETLV